jgi:hypothetical protein
MIIKKVLKADRNTLEESISDMFRTFETQQRLMIQEYIHDTLSKN